MVNMYDLDADERHEDYSDEPNTLDPQIVAAWWEAEEQERLHEAGFRLRDEHNGIRHQMDRLSHEVCK